MWIPTAAVLILLVVVEVRTRRKKRRAALEITGFDKAQQLLRLKQQLQRDEITDEEYHLERTRLLQ